MASTMFGKGEVEHLFVRCFSAVPVHFARAGVVYASLSFRGHFSFSVEVENPDRIDHVG